MKIAHVGNIANNGYLATGIHREMGVDAYCLSPKYGHVMGFPFWEESSLYVAESEHWSGARIHSELSEEKDHWPMFWSGDWAAITSRTSQDPRKLGTSSSQATGVTESVRSTLSKTARSGYGKLPDKLQSLLANYGLWYLGARQAQTAFEILDRFFDGYVLYGPYAELGNYTRRPYVAFEHGTLRDWALGPSPRQKRTLRGFQQAQMVLISNHDVLADNAVDRLGLGPSVFSAHPISEDSLESNRRQRKQLIAKCNAQPVILCPARHTWGQSRHGAKGTELLVESVIMLARRHPELKFHFVRWGQDVARSERAIRDAGLDANVIWSETMTRPLLREKMAEAVCVIDQFRAPAFGAIGTDAMAIGTPLLTRSNKDVESRIFGFSSPAFDITDVASCVSQVENVYDPYTPVWISTEWYDSNLSRRVFKAALEKTGSEWSRSAK